MLVSRAKRRKRVNSFVWGVGLEKKFKSSGRRDRRPWGGRERLAEGKSSLQPCWADGEGGGRQKEEKCQVVEGSRMGQGGGASVFMTWIAEDEDEF